MRITIVNLLCLGLLFAGLRTSAAAETFVGIVKSVEGGAIITRNGETITVVTGMKIRQADVVKTDHHGHVGLVFSDDTRITDEGLGIPTEALHRNF